MRNSYSDDEGYYDTNNRNHPEESENNYLSLPKKNENIFREDDKLSNQFYIDGLVNRNEDSDDDELTLDNRVESFEKWSTKIRNSYNPISPDLLDLEEINEKEGLIFKHLNYKITILNDIPNTNATAGKSVIRRYSDFLWLRNVLLKKYPFRIIPLLPPKHVGLQSPSKIFLDARRDGLSKFINMVVRHPVLKKEELMSTFLTVPIEISSWRKTALYDTSDEYHDKKVKEEFKRIFVPSLMDEWNSLPKSLNKSIILWSKLLNLVERHRYKEYLIAKHNLLFKNNLNEFTIQTNALYPTTFSNTTHNINDHLNEIGKHLSKSSELQEKENLEMVNRLIPKFITYVITLKSLQKLRQRYDILATNSIGNLRKRVLLNEEKLESMKGKPDVSGVEYDTILIRLNQDKKLIADQINRSWLIKKTILEEFIIFQQTQFMITETFQEWTNLHAKYHGLELNEWEALAVDLTRMATIE
ncbi:hypothetical protein TPHA_0F02450 [Tetrapisispora phaffii CBS 4417]|uniref:Sorting nexin MVP1 n=1 Tax=Tetrapisispora phaffii (strain ATCC 24235 / CBS 4417 / NBRC 1672 / NRRL Y-8282 / UCD 70-5) TaxID=1071381 RepID=G8BUE0_TETPH|nr:hypothetical protein TPHA_0F02450 [Tetrapisispora phaffii CBS 4417]CCE63726.1 hypothetical protein TPHA_0F02450 [Tetrapisispora phaffii CBS 4417]